MEFTYDDTGARAKFGPLTVGKIFNAVRNEAHAWAIEEEGRFRETHLSGRPGLNRWSGGLSRSFLPIWQYGVETRAGFMFAPTVRTPNGDVENYAWIHEKGGMIYPKNGRMLAWPVKGGPEMTEGGRNRFGDSPRNYPGKLFFWQSPSGAKFLAESIGKGKGAKLRTVYNLANSVDIPPRLGFRNFALPALRRGARRLDEAKGAAIQEIEG